MNWAELGSNSSAKLEIYKSFIKVDHKLIFLNLGFSNFDLIKYIKCSLKCIENICNVSYFFLIWFKIEAVLEIVLL